MAKWSPGKLRRAHESSGEPRRVQERSGKVRGAKGIQRSQVEPGKLRRAQGKLGGA